MTDATTKAHALLNLIGDGNFYSGEALGQCLGVSRAAVWKRLEELKAAGVEVESVRGKGYRLLDGRPLLSKKNIQLYLDQQNAFSVDELHVDYVIDSTNRKLMRRIVENSHKPLRAVCVAEAQSAGQGRRGRQWQSPFGRNVYFSMSWPFSGGAASLSGLSLAVGVALIDALSAFDTNNIKLKWPNDVLLDNKKLAGVLIEIAGDAMGECHAIIGIGLNVAMPEEEMQSVDQPWTDLVSGLSVDPDIDRNSLIALLIQSLGKMLFEFENEGFAPFYEQWMSLNAHANKPVQLVSGNKITQGVMLGITPDGGVRLKLENNEEQVFIGGEISLRGSQA